MNSLGEYVGMYPFGNGEILGYIYVHGSKTGDASLTIQVQSYRTSCNIVLKASGAISCNSLGNVGSRCVDGFISYRVCLPLLELAGCGRRVLGLGASLAVQLVDGGLVVALAHVVVAVIDARAPAPHSRSA